MAKWTHNPHAGFWYTSGGWYAVKKEIAAPRWVGFTHRHPTKRWSSGWVKTMEDAMRLVEQQCANDG